MVVSNNKRIAKNTLFLYFRTFVILIVNLYTSRVILQQLGVEDYGIYNVVGGVVTLLTFMNAALSTGSSRFITYEMGKERNGDVKTIFQSTLFAHIVLALIIAFVAETAGIWFVYNKLVIDASRMTAAVLTYHLSVLTALMTIVQVPFTAMIIANERMDYFAYCSILDAILKLLIVFFLPLFVIDKLVIYAILLCLVQIIITTSYVLYCKKQFVEVTIHNFKTNWRKIKEIVSFSSWSLLGNAAHALNGQGVTIITNMFFNSSVVTARALSIQVNSAAMSMVQNIGLAANPQIVKLYSSGEYEKSRTLLLNTARYSFMLMLLLSVPLISVCREILTLWLVDVPEYTIIFVQLILIQSLFFTIDTALYTALYACGKVKQNALISPTLYFIQFIVIYFLFRAGFSPISLSIAGIVTSMVAGVMVKPLLLHLYANYPLKLIYNSIIRCVITFILSIPIPIYLVINQTDNVQNFLVRANVGIFVSILCIAFVGVTRKERLFVLNYINKKILQNNVT